MGDCSWNGAQGLAQARVRRDGLGRLPESDGMTTSEMKLPGFVLAHTVPVESGPRFWARPTSSVTRLYRADDHLVREQRDDKVAHPFVQSLGPSAYPSVYVVLIQSSLTPSATPFTTLTGIL